MRSYEIFLMTSSYLKIKILVKCKVRSKLKFPSFNPPNWWLPLFQMTAGVRVTIALLDGRKLPVSVSPRLHTRDLLALAASHCGHTDTKYFSLAHVTDKWVYYASPSSGEAYRDRRLKLILSWIFCVPTCFQMRIPDLCLSVCPSVCPSVCSPRKEITLASSISVLH